MPSWPLPWFSAAWAAPWAGAGCPLPSPGQAGGWAAARRQVRRQAPATRWRAARSTRSMRGRGRGSLLLALAHRGEDGLVCLVLGGLVARVGRRRFAAAVDVQLAAATAAQDDDNRAGRRRGARRADQLADLRVLGEAVTRLRRRVLRSGRVTPLVVDVLEAAQDE